MTLSTEARQHIAKALDAARATGERQHVAIDVDAGANDPLPFATLEIDDRFYLERPSEGLRVLALGCRQAVESTQWAKSRLSPLVSAIARKAAGSSRPRVGWRQRSRASMPTSSPLRKLTSGW